MLCRKLVADWHENERLQVFSRILSLAGVRQRNPLKNEISPPNKANRDDIVKTYEDC